MTTSGWGSTIGATHEPGGKKRTRNELHYKRREPVIQLPRVHDRSSDHAAGNEVLYRKGQSAMCILTHMGVDSVVATE